MSAKHLKSTTENNNIKTGLICPRCKKGGFDNVYVMDVGNPILVCLDCRRQLITQKRKVG